MMFKNILVAIDGSQHGEKAAHLAGEMARMSSADLWVLNTFEPVPSYLGEPNLSQAISARTHEAEEIVAKTQSDVGEIPGHIHSETLEGPPAEAILNLAEVREIDLIIMGTRGLSRLAGVLLGSQSQKVISHADCPVMLAR